MDIIKRHYRYWRYNQYGYDHLCRNARKTSDVFQFDWFWDLQVWSLGSILLMSSISFDSAGRHFHEALLLFTSGSMREQDRAVKTKEVTLGLCSDRQLFWRRVQTGDLEQPRSKVVSCQWKKRFSPAALNAQDVLPAPKVGRNHLQTIRFILKGLLIVRQQELRYWASWFLYRIMA